ncbi:aldehyde oxidase glox1 [Quercus suber]|uniref:Aldehyde oxidase glox1 n=2 Tax=Quercus suber TaxID=58331 RepID=A0AAW0KQS7_QUESU
MEREGRDRKQREAKEKGKKHCVFKHREAPIEGISSMAALLRTLIVFPLLLTVHSQFWLPNPFRGSNDDQDKNAGLKLPGITIPILGSIGIGGDTDKADQGANPTFETDYKGLWMLLSADSGANAMHVNLLPNNKIIMFDATAFRMSTLKLPNGECIPYKDDKKRDKEDCWSHGVEFDYNTGYKRPLKMVFDPWCSSGGLTADGILISTGGWKDGTRTVRYMDTCEDCDWKEFQYTLADARWYATQITLADGGFFLVGGRKSFSYEYVPPEGKSNAESIKFPFLYQTTDIEENNLYPFVHLSSDGNVFIFANNRSVLLNPKTNKIIKEFPILEGGSRNYPASAMSALLPIKLYVKNAATIAVEVIICGGAKPQAYTLAQNSIFIPALQDCNRLQITKPNAQWKKETMPTPRVMGDMLNLPNGDLLILNGAKQGTSAWYSAEDPNLNPILYSPYKPMNQRFKVLNPTIIPRMYHSAVALLPDGKVLVGGSNPNPGYNFTAKYPTEMRIEKFSPPYLDPALAIHRPIIIEEASETTLTYEKNFMVQFRLGELFVDKRDVKVSMYAPPFTTHGYSMNQRLLLLGKVEVREVFPTVYQVNVVAPPTREVAPAGYYLIFVVYRGVPSKAMWVQIK